MKTKSIIAMLALLAVSASSVFAIPASAAPEQDSVVDAPVSPQYSHAAEVSSSLTIADGFAYCHSYGRGQSHVASMTCYQYLEKKNWLGNYTIVINSKYKQTQGNSIIIDHTQPNLESGTYRVRSVFTFFAVGGYEEVEVSSPDRKY